MSFKLRPRYRLIPHEWTRGHDVRVTLSLPGDEMLRLLGAVNIGLAVLEKPDADTTAEDSAQYRAQRLEVIALMHEIEARQEAAAKVLREEEA